MQLSAAEAERIAREGADALRSGRAGEAKRHFERIAASGLANAQIWLLLAHSSRLAGDLAGAERAADEVLRQEGRNLRSLLIKGDVRQRSGDERAASSFYGTALKVAAQLASVPKDLEPELAIAETVIGENAGRYRERLETRLAAVPQSDRFRESLALMFGEKQVYYQKPSAYYFPRLPQIQFHDPAQFAWAAAIEAASDDILAELRSVLGDEALFEAYLQPTAERPNDDFHGMLGNPDWSTLHLFREGKPVAKAVERCPSTYQALQAAPLCRITTRAPSILFSLLKAGARIPPHHGMINTRLICHLPLIVPPRCALRVGNEVREWQPGKLLIFDDTIEHEAWNESDEDRVVLIFDVWRPELTDEERAGVAAMFEAIDGPASDPAQ